MNELKKVDENNTEVLIKLLENTDDKERRKARKSLVNMGKKAVLPLSLVMENSNVYKARWEAAKALGEICDPRSIPSLVKALNDKESDVAWLAAKALQKFKKAAWPELLNSLVNQGAVSVPLRRGAHHIFHKQHSKGFSDLLDDLKKSLENDTVPESIPVAAYKLLSSMHEREAGKKSH